MRAALCVVGCCLMLAACGDSTSNDDAGQDLSGSDTISDTALTDGPPDGGSVDSALGDGSPGDSAVDSAPPAGDPPEATCGAPTIWAEDLPGQQAKVTLSNGTVITTSSTSGGPLTNPLAEAMNRAQPGDVIAVKGNLKGVTIGKYDPNKSFAVFWANGAIVQNVCIVSEDPNNPATISGISITGDISQSGGHGVDELIFKDVILENPPGSATPVIVFQNSKQGMIRFYDVKIQSGDPGSYGGYGMKWGARFHGRTRTDWRRVTFAAAQEHALYIDSPGWDGGGDSYFIDLEQLAPSGRTSIQIVNRANPAQGGGPTGMGKLWFRRIKAKTQKGEGGSGITIAGHLGEVEIDDLLYEGDLGAITFWSDAGKGLHTNSGGFTCVHAILKNIEVQSPNADRSHVAIAGCEDVDIYDFSINGNRTAIDLWNNFSGPVDNGQVRLHVTQPVSQYAGFNAGTKMKYQNNTLTPAQIDAYWAP